MGVNGLMGVWVNGLMGTAGVLKKYLLGDIVYSKVE